MGGAADGRARARPPGHVLQRAASLSAALTACGRRFPRWLTMGARAVAMMGKTFSDEMEDTHRIWVFPFASMVLRYEKMLDKKARILYRHGREARSTRLRVPRHAPTPRPVPPRPAPPPSSLRGRYTSEARRGRSALDAAGSRPRKRSRCYSGSKFCL